MTMELNGGRKAEEPIVERQPTKTRLAASYARKSDPNEDGLATQHEINRRQAARDGYVLLDELCFGDDDTSGVSTSRRNFDRLKALIESGEAGFDALYVRNSKRFGRWSDPGMHDYLRIHFQKHGVRLLYAEGPNPDYAGGMTPDVAVASMWARMENISGSTERTETRSRIITGIRRAVVRGFYPGTTAPYGTERWLADKHTGHLIARVQDGLRVRKDGCAYRLVWNDEGGRLEAVKSMFRLLDQEEYTLEEVARKLQAAGYPPPGRARTKVSKWTATAVRYIVQNPLYVGDLVWGRGHPGVVPVPHDQAELNVEGPIIFRGFMSDPPVSHELFDAVQRILELRRRGRHDGIQPVPYILTGRILCTKCGARWFGFTSTRQENNRRRYYRHEQVERHSKRDDTPLCPHRNRYIRALELEQLVIQQALTAVQGNALEEQIRSEIRCKLELLRSQDNTDRAERLVDHIARREEEIDRAIRERAQTTNITLLSRYDLVLKEMARGIEEMQLQLAELRNERDQAQRALDHCAEALAKTRDLLGVFEAAPLRQKRAILSEVIESIKIDAEANHVTVRILLPSPARKAA